MPISECIWFDLEEDLDADDKLVLNPCSIQDRKKVNCHLIFIGSFVAILAFCATASEYADLVKISRGVPGKPEEEAQLLLLADMTNLVTRSSSIGAYIDRVVRRGLASCETTFPDSKLFDEYPPVTHNAVRRIPNSPEGTIVAYALTVTRCPEFSASGVDGIPDPSKHIFQATVIIKDEICNANDALEIMKKENGSLVGHTL